MVFTFFGFGLILGIIAVVSGHIHKSKINKEPEIYGGEGCLYLVALLLLHIRFGFLSLLFLGGILAAIGIEQLPVINILLQRKDKKSFETFEKL